MNKEIKSFEDACKVLSIKPVLPSVEMLPEANQKAVIANYKLDIIQQAINGDWKADWNNWGQLKYYPWFAPSSSGVGFSYDGYGYGRTLTFVSSRRVFETSEIAEFMGSHFIDLYNDAMSI